jgi:hypothetical protein
MNLHNTLQQIFFNTQMAFKTIPIQAFWVMVGMGGLFILYFVYQSYKCLKRARALEDTPTAKIRSAAQGYVELAGEQHIFGKPEITRLSRLPCTWYRYAIEFLDQQNGWRLIEHGMGSQLFELRDGTGVCIIDPNGAEITTTQIDRWQGFARYPNKKPASWVGRLWGSFGKYRYTEWTMNEGMSLHAMGNFHTYSGQQFAAFYPKYASLFNPDDSVHLLSKSGLDTRSPFVLSSITEKEAIWKHRKDAFLWFVAYMSLLAVVGWLLVARFH